MSWQDGSTGSRTHQRLEPLAEAVFSRAGVLVIGPGAGRYYVVRAGKILRVVAAVGTAPVGASIICDVNLNGTTIFTTQSNRPTIAAAATKVASTPTPDITTVAAGDLLSVDLDQVGSITPGSDLTVIVLLGV